MQTLANGYRGLSLVMVLNADRFIALGVIFAGLWLGAYIGQN